MKRAFSLAVSIGVFLLWVKIGRALGIPEPYPFTTGVSAGFATLGMLSTKSPDPATQKS